MPGLKTAVVANGSPHPESIPREFDTDLPTFPITLPRKPAGELSFCLSPISLLLGRGNWFDNGFKN